MSVARFNTWESLDGSTSRGIADIPSAADIQALAAQVAALSSAGEVLCSTFASLDAALASSALNLVIDKAYTVGANTTWPATKNYRFIRGGILTVAAGVTLTIRGVVTAGRFQIFTGAGSVVGIRAVQPAWWGAVGNGSTDCTAAFNAASACVEASLASAGGRPDIDIGSGQFLLSSTWTVRPSADINLSVRGAGTVFSGTRLVASSSFTAGPVLQVNGSADATQKIADFQLRDFGIVPQTVGAGGATVGLSFGSTSTTLIGLQESKIENIYVGNLPVGIRLLNTRLVNFSRCSVWNDGLSTVSTCLHIKADSNFCGDMTFHNCQFVNKHTVVGSRNIYMESQYGSYASNNLYQLAGVRFIECIIYPAYQAVKGYAANGAYLTDVFFTNCQWDGNSYGMVDFEGNGSGTVVRDIYLNDNYMYGGNMSSGIDGVIFQATGTGSAVRNLHVTGNTIGQCAGRAFNAYGCTGVTFHGNMVYENNNSSAAAVEFGGNSARLIVSDNMLTRTAGVFPAYFIQINSGCDYYMVTGNMGGGIVSLQNIRDQSSSTNKVVANNL